VRAELLRSRLHRGGRAALAVLLQRTPSLAGHTTVLMVAALACAQLPPVGGSAQAAPETVGPPAGTGEFAPTGPELPLPPRWSPPAPGGLAPPPQPAGGEPATAGSGPSGPAADGAPPPAAVEPPPVRAADAVPSERHVGLGKGMWLYQLSQTAGADSVVAQARAVGLTHLYLRLGSTIDGFYDQSELDQLLPVAHAGGLKVVGWDFPYLFDPAADAQRAFDEISYATPDGHHIDAFSADIETAAEGVNLTAGGASAYGARLRELAGPGYPLIATVPRPSPGHWFPFAEATAAFDAIAPMVYWLNRDPVADVTGALADLAPFGKPVLPIGQAYDGGPEGGPPGKPPKEALVRFMDAALARGALGVSFWAWHHLTADQWSAVHDATAWDRPQGATPKS